MSIGLYIEENLTFVEEFLKEHLPKAIYHIPQGTYFAWIDLSLMVTLLKH